MVLPALKRTASSPLLRPSRLPPLRSLGIPPSEAGKKYCTYCGKDFTSVYRHYAQYAACGRQAGFDALSEAQAREMQRAKARGETSDSEDEWVDEMDVDGTEDMEDLQFFDELGLLDIQQLETIPLEESVLLPDYDEDEEIHQPPPDEPPAIPTKPSRIEARP